jgi:hypothetical protein
MLVDEMVRHMPQEHPQAANLAKALDKLRNVCQQQQQERERPS